VPVRLAQEGLASALRARGDSVEPVLGNVKPKRALADADRAGAVRIYLVGPEERARGVSRERELASGHEHEEPLPAASA
jgi:histidyl-tRNA synthetase